MNLNCLYQKKKRLILEIEKKKETNNKYPRKSGIAIKK